jgi:hypothetical protein
MFLVLISVGGWVNVWTIVWLEGLGKLKKSNGLIGTRSRDLLPCSIAHQPIKLLHASHVFIALCLINHNNVTSYQSVRLQNCWFLYLKFYDWYFVGKSNVPKDATRPTHLTNDNLKLNKGYKPWNFSLCNFIHHPITSSVRTEQNLELLLLNKFQ